MPILLLLGGLLTLGVFALSAADIKPNLETEPQVQALGAEALTFDNLPYRRYVHGASLPGDYALLIFLHGSGSVGNDNYRQMRIAGKPVIDFLQQQQIKAVVLWPQCPADSPWIDMPLGEFKATPTVSMQQVIGLVEMTTRQYPIDYKRIYAGGISLGGYGTWDLAARHPDWFAGLLIICGSADVKTAPELKGIPTYIIHGDRDPAVPVADVRNIVGALQAAGADSIIYREIPGAEHNVWDLLFADDAALSWLFAQKRK